MFSMFVQAHLSGEPGEADIVKVSMAISKQLSTCHAYITCNFEDPTFDYTFTFVVISQQVNI